MDAVGERIKKARQAKGLSQEELAQIINSTKSAISRYESGKRQPRLDQLHRIAVALRVSDDYLLSGEAQVSQLHLTNGVHIYKNTFPFKNSEPVLVDFPEDTFHILYQDEHTIIIVENNASATMEELETILMAYAPEKILQSPLAKQVFDEMEVGKKIQLYDAFTQLNFMGQDEAVKRVEELTEIPRYRRQEPAEAPPASPKDTDTPTEQDAAEGGENK